MQKSSFGGAKLSAAALQLSLSTFLSRRLALMTAKTIKRRQLLAKSVRNKKRHKRHSRVIDEKRFAFDMIDGHWN